MELYRDIAQCYGVSLRIQRTELGVIQNRVRTEGISFLTKGLPRLGKAVDTALSSGAPLTTIGFKTDGAIPKFLGWLLNRVFTSAGLELDQPDPIALKHFRQFVYLVYKLEIPYAKKTAQAVLEAFVRTEQDLSELSDDCLDSEWIYQARDFMSRIVSTFDPLRITPKHGPGAVATGEDTIEKSNLKRIYKKIEAIYPFMEWMRFNLNHVVDSWTADQQVLEEHEESTAKVVLVPKDSRGPRLISCEPLEVQWIQQGLGNALREHIETNYYTSGHVNFRDQEVNRRLALVGSLDNQWVTLDMQEASDRVSLKLVSRLFSGHPRLLEALIATRSDATVLPDGRLVRMLKFAPMGSNLCFPVESVVFYALAVSAIRQAGWSWRNARAAVFVYGDDLIIRKEVYSCVIAALPTVGLKFNSGKCCTARSFRESCGCDAYFGVDITPIKLKTVWSSSSSCNPDILGSYVAFSNAMFGLGYYRTAEYVRTKITKKYGDLPLTNRFTIASNGAYVSTSSGYAYVSRVPVTPETQPASVRVRFSRTLHQWECMSYSSVPKKVRTKIDGYSEWLRRLSAKYGNHGGSYALVRRNRLKRTWTPL